jgi:predicted nuclease of predicted toxin-antitoxin system
LGHRFNVSAKTVKEIGLRDADDLVLFEAARRLGTLAIMTKDSDFADLVKRLGTPPLIGAGQALVEIAGT